MSVDDEIGVSKLTCDICGKTIDVLTTIYSTDGNSIVLHNPGDKFTCLECIIKNFDGE